MQKSAVGDNNTALQSACESHDTQPFCLDVGTVATDKIFFLDDALAINFKIL